MLIQRIAAIVIVVLMHDFTVLKYVSIVFIIFLNLTHYYHHFPSLQ